MGADISVLDRAKFLELRLLIGFLGERTQHGWWPTGFYERSSRLFLEPVFSRTTRLAQYHGVLEAARRLHDEHLNVGSYHLFRLPEEIEQDLHGLMHSGVGDRLAEQATQCRETAMEALVRFAASGKAAGEGPHAVGAVGDLGSEQTMGAMAAAYGSAFARGIRAYPYLLP